LRERERESALLQYGNGDLYDACSKLWTAGDICEHDVIGPFLDFVHPIDRFHDFINFVNSCRDIYNPVSFGHSRDRRKGDQQRRCDRRGSRWRSGRLSADRSLHHSLSAAAEAARRTCD